MILVFNWMMQHPPNSSLVSHTHTYKYEMEPIESISKKHFHLSLIKSGLRIVGCFIAGIEDTSSSVLILCVFFALAEVIGIWEEL